MVNLRNETKVGLLYALEDFTKLATGELLLPVKRQSRDEREPKPRPANVYKARLPDMASYQKKAPFILHQAVTGDDAMKNANKGTGQQIRRELQSICVVRSVFCVYHPDEQEGGLALLNLMEEMRTALLLFPILDNLFELDLEEGISQMVYPETGERGTAPFYLGEMVTTWKLPAIKRLDAARVVQGLPPVDPKAVYHTNKLQ
ncbi:hypothetical protein D1159_00160 [Pseudoflavonifractor sp. 524-17]|uniref:hypothetical protein n=1 Tax=Pseudoflavonifractor sp. 524-17 TaxID=2304577 RepID=UPI0013794E3B|nr:hypothetical protein [Pseudoflavonifractor sp. 524-17]NCE63025.1 hypothetical protein [Pseudoflavonifractor sp. 524-17]